MQTKTIIPLGHKNIDRLNSIHQQAADIQRYAVNMLSAQKIGRDWRMDMRRAADRISQFAEELVKE